MIQHGRRDDWPSDACSKGRLPEFQGRIQPCDVRPMPSHKSIDSNEFIYSCEGGKRDERRHSSSALGGMMRVRLFSMHEEGRKNGGKGTVHRSFFSCHSRPHFSDKSALSRDFLAFILRVKAPLETCRCTSVVCVHLCFFGAFGDSPALGLAGWLLVGLSTAALLLLLGLCADAGSHVVRHCHTRHKETTVIVLTVYPVLGLCSYLGLLFQRANLFLDAAAQLWFALCMWQFLDLTLSYFGGESRFVAKMEGATLPWKGPPCCCWPCCVCPQSTVNKRQIRFVKILVMQHPWVQLVASIFQLTLWLEGWYTHMDIKPDNAYIYIYLISTTSFSFGLWAFIVGFKASLKQLQEFHYTPKIVTFQLCLVFLRLQAIIVNSILVPSGAIPCLPPISPRVFANTLLNALLLGQLVVLSVLARHYYKLPTPEIVSLNHANEFKGDATKNANDPPPAGGSYRMITEGKSPEEGEEEEEEVQPLNHSSVSVV